MSTSPLKLENLSKKFGTKNVLDGINLELEGGEIFGLVGLNGVGKTTMIKIILGLLEADSGSSFLFGENSTRPEARKNICYLPEKFAPSIYLKGHEFISLSTAYHGHNPDISTINNMAERVDLEVNYLNKRVSKYSKGMGQKVGLIATLLSNAPLLILDEPMSGLDPKARILLKDELISYKNAGHTVFFSSHILSDLEEICDRIAVLNDTKLIFTGKVQDFINKYSPGSSLEKTFLASIS